ncbi:YciI family protein [Sphingomonas cannabina]|uniref:YciI family protein n=1 Tax=Sphingomonas cannabina TaxID=2899123 RepID=UPI001F36D761|nr:YciI family protein [Sphingomonas cannabina]UIJ46819.1 YciI family protein [Sphingomonas cannabina]
MARVEAAPVSIITLTYRAPVEEIDRLLPEHVAWLEKGFDEGLFLIAGRQVPRVGGVILCRGHRAEVEALAATDPFVTSGASDFAVTEVAASMAAPAIAALLR